MLKVFQSSAEHNPCKEIFSLASSAYSRHDLLAQAILERWWQAHPSMFYLAYHDKNLCGYISAFPLTTKAFQTTLNHDFDEKTLEPSALAEFKTKGDYQLYFSSIVVHPALRKKGIARRLRQAFLAKLIELWDAGFCVKHASALVVSKEGTRIMQSLGFQVHSKAQQGSLFYAQYDKAKLLECLKKLS